MAQYVVDEYNSGHPFDNYTFVVIIDGLAKIGQKKGEYVYQINDPYIIVNNTPIDDEVLERVTKETRHQEKNIHQPGFFVDERKLIDLCFKEYLK